MTPEQRAFQQIDLLLEQCGWIVQSRSETNLSAGPGVAIREALLKTGEADYLLFADGKAIATVEAKPEGYTLTGVEGQSLKYATGLLDNRPAALCYESTGSEARFKAIQFRPLASCIVISGRYQKVRGRL
jgi:type I restriction enzyme, R subunit